MFLQERAFVTDAERQVELLIDAVQIPDQLACARALITVKACAQTVSARGVIAAAKVCEYTLAAQPYALSDMHRSLATLQRLISQYRSGLEEIDPGFSANAAANQDAYVAPQIKINAAAPAAITPEQTQVCENELAETQLLIGTTPTLQAREVLTQLTRFAREDEIGALTDLMRLSGSLHLDNYSADDVKMSPRSVQAESIMTPITNAVLASAHRFGKSVSLSYAVGESRLSASEAQSVQKMLTLLCTCAIEQGLGTAIARRREGLPATGQISITSTHAQRQRGPRFELSGDGIDSITLDETLMGIAVGENLELSHNDGSIYVTLLGGSEKMAQPDIALADAPNLMDAFDIDLTGDTVQGALA